MRFAYADPPYPGTAKRYYGERDDYAGEVDHGELLRRLYEEYPDGWALSTSVRALWTLLPLIPVDWKCRIGAWVKPYGAQRGDLANGRVANSWEPLIWRGGRKPGPRGRIRRDWVLTNNQSAQPGRRYSARGSFPGAKPDEFCYWLFEVLNMQPGDDLVDLFPGTGRVMRAWEQYQRAGMALFVEE